MTNPQINQESLSRAVSSQSVMNYPGIFYGFEAMGIPADDIKPRENVFTYNAWKALGRQVRKGEHGVKATTFVPVSGKKNVETGESKDGFRMPRTVTVFHVSQTDPIAAN
jgi:antirestriction protein ArdC